MSSAVSWMAEFLSYRRDKWYTLARPESDDIALHLVVGVYDLDLEDIFKRHEVGYVSVCSQIRNR